MEAEKNVGRVVGFSAYEVWLNEGNSGTEQDFLDSLKGKDGTEVDLTGYATETFVTNKIAEAQLGGSEVDLSGYATKDDLKAKVDKVTGKGLSTNDYTTAEKNKLESLNNYDDTEIRAEISEKADSEDIPTKTSQLTNDSGYITEDDIPEIPTKLSELENDTNYISTIPNNYKTKSENDELYQEKLVSGTNIKTINGVNILGEGNVEIEGGELASSPLTGKKLSLIGDSITTYRGYLPSGNATRYPKGVITSVEQTWWKQLLNETGMVIGQNCAWDGSTCSGLSTSTTNAYAGCSDKRISQLELNGTPDIIICYIGINDWGATYNRNETQYGGTFTDGAFVPVGEYTGETALPSGELKTFSEAYGCMIGKIQQSYPNAKLYCCTLLQTNGKVTYNYDADGVFPSVNRDGVSIADYNNCIRTLAKNMGASVIEFAECGIHWGNIDTYMEDGLHPNVEGMKLLKEKAKNKLKLDFNAEIVKSYVSEGGSSYDDTALRTLIAELQNGKQDTLISGENIKTINGNSILGEGNLSLQTETRYTITVNAENVTLSNVKNDILAGLDYETNVNCDSGYKLGNVSIVMDENDITDSAFTKNSSTNATINIKNVDGNVVINVETIAVPTYSITNNLTNVKNSNSAANIVENEPYQATLTADNIYYLEDENVTITMGGVDITSSVYANGEINIVNATGNIVITASGTAKPSYSVTNNLTNATTNNPNSNVVQEASYEAIITPDKYYSLDDSQVVITMGGADITSDVYNNGVINIPSVTGAIIITITATANEITWYTNHDQSKYTGSVIASSKGWAVSRSKTMDYCINKPVNRVSFVSTASSGTMEICLAQRPATTVSETPMRNIEYIDWDSSNKVGNIVTIEIPTVTPISDEYFTVFANSTPDTDAFCYYDAGTGNGDFYSYVNKPNTAWQDPTKYQLLFNFGYCAE